MGNLIFLRAERAKEFKISGSVNVNCNAISIWGNVENVCILIYTNRVLNIIKYYQLSQLSPLQVINSVTHGAH